MGSQSHLLGEFPSQLLECRQERHCAQGAEFSPLAACAQPAWHVCRMWGQCPRGLLPRWHEWGSIHEQEPLPVTCLEDMWLWKRFWGLKRL